MRAVIQRVSQSSVSVDGQLVGQIGPGLLVLLGVADGDQQSDLDYMVNKVTGLRVFEDSHGKMNLSVQDIQGSLLVVSQFTLLGDVRRGKRPSFTDAAAPEIANQLYEEFCGKVEAMNVSVQRGVFRADMKVSLINDGPVTILLDSRKLF
ncbi:MAG: D-aminoacyl-tRNA deacylase [Pirellulales bacterium]